jgi:hypothetical protein
MLLAGRLTALAALLGPAVLAVLLLVRPELGAPSTGEVRPIDLAALLMLLAMLATWVGAIWHWATHHPPGGGRTRWGLIVVLGFTIGATAYWFVGTREGVA